MPDTRYRRGRAYAADMAVYARTAGAVGVAVALGRCVIPFIIPDLAKIALACIMTWRLTPVLKNL